MTPRRHRRSGLARRSLLIALVGAASVVPAGAALAQTPEYDNSHELTIGNMTCERDYSIDESGEDWDLSCDDGEGTDSNEGQSVYFHEGGDRSGGFAADYSADVTSEGNDASYDESFTLEADGEASHSVSGDQTAGDVSTDTHGADSD